MRGGSYVTFDHSKKLESEDTRYAKSLKQDTLDAR